MKEQRGAHVWLHVLCFICQESVVHSLHLCFTGEPLRPFLPLLPFRYRVGREAGESPEGGHWCCSLEDEQHVERAACANALWSQRAPVAEG